MSATGATRTGVDLCTGHDCFPPRVSAEGSPNVYVNGIKWHRENDLWEIHCCPGSGCHSSYLENGSSNVFVNSLEASRIGDPIECGSDVDEGSENVFVGP